VREDIARHETRRWLNDRRCFRIVSVSVDEALALSSTKRSRGNAPAQPDRDGSNLEHPTLDRVA